VSRAGMIAIIMVWIAAAAILGWIIHAYWRQP
jgi:hypothetical protein